MVIRMAQLKPYFVTLEYLVSRNIPSLFGGFTYIAIRNGRYKNKILSAKVIYKISQHLWFLPGRFQSFSYTVWILRHQIPQLMLQMPRCGLILCISELPTPNISMKIPCHRERKRQNYSTRNNERATSQMLIYINTMILRASGEPWNQHKPAVIEICNQSH